MRRRRSGRGRQGPSWPPGQCRCGRAHHRRQLRHARPQRLATRPQLRSRPFRGTAAAQNPASGARRTVTRGPGRATWRRGHVQEGLRVPPTSGVLDHALAGLEHDLRVLSDLAASIRAHARRECLVEAGGLRDKPHHVAQDGVDAVAGDGVSRDEKHAARLLGEWLSPSGPSRRPPRRPSRREARRRRARRRRSRRRDRAR